MRTGTRVKIKSGMGEFIGKVGTVVGHERDGSMLLNRVRLDEPVHILTDATGQTGVKDDLWANCFLTNLDAQARAKARRRGLREAMGSIGAVRVRGAMGGTYWE